MSKRRDSIDDLGAAQLRSIVRVIRRQAFLWPNNELASFVSGVLEESGVRPLVKCGGEAHSNSHIDGCAICAQAWGYHEEPPAPSKDGAA